MATDDLDPAQANRRVNEQLQIAVMKLDEHIQALTQPTMELALAQQKRIAETGLEERDLSTISRRFISQAGPGATIGTSEPGQLNKDASEPPGVTEPLSLRTGQEQPPLSSIPGRPGELQGIVPGVSQQQKESIEQEQYVVPQYGKFQVDAYLRMARKAAMAKAGETEPGSGEPNRWASVAGKLNTAVEKAPEVVAGYQAAKSYFKPIMDIGFGAANFGASMGYSPQAGTGLNASHVFGIPNPIAAFTSPAGRQGLGTTVNALEASIGGTGIGIGEATGLRQALGAQGWSNERAGGAFGFSEGGAQENLALALEGPMKKGFKNPEVLAEFTSALKLGSGNIGELTKGIENLSETAKMTHQTLEAEAIKAQEFMSKTVEAGSTMMHGLTAYGEIGKATKMNPAIIQGINEGQFGNVQALSKGIMPWEIGGMTGNAAALNAYETVKKVAAYVPKQSNAMAVNKVTGKDEVIESEEEKKLAYIHMLEPSITAEQAKRLLKIGPSLEAVQGGLGEASTIQQHRYEMENWNKYHSAQGTKAHQAMADSHGRETRIATLEAEAKKQEAEGYPAMAEQIKDTIKEERDKLKKTLQSAGDIAAKSGAMNAGQKDALRRELEGPKGLYATASAAGVDAGELGKIKKEDLWKQSGDITKALEKLNKVNVEKQNEENAKIELAGPAKAFFKLKFPAAAAKSESNEGGPAISNKAASPNVAGETASEASLLKASEKAQRAESTVGIH